MKTNKMNLRTRHVIRFLFSMLFIMSLNTGLAQTDKLSDTEISNAVTTELMLHMDVPSYYIDVETDEGIVTLSGMTDNILAKKQAKNVAMAVRGVRAVVNKIDVDTPEKSDQELKNDVERALLYDPATESYEVDINAEKGHIVLSGEVDSWQEKKLSGRVAKSVYGVKSLENNITFDPTEGRMDFEMKQDIEKMLENDIRVDNAMINVTVENGVATLDGVVGSATEKDLAKMKAWVSGITEVDVSQLNVEKWARDENLRDDKYTDRSDEQIEAAVNDALWYDPRVNYFDIRVVSYEGVVTLDGTVDNLKAKKAAKHDAQNTVGVFSVRNLIKVRPANQVEDETLENRVESALYIDPFVQSYELTVLAQDGKIYIGGTVDSYFEKYQAEDVASKAKGIVDVNNNIAVDNDMAYDGGYYYYDYNDWNTVYPTIYTSYIVTEPMTDWEIENRIEDQLYWSPFVDLEDVKVEVEGSIATLTGTVDTYNEKSYATTNAFEGGAEFVENKLKVETGPE